MLSPDQQGFVVDLLRPFASRVAVFGSEARGEARAGSDLDVLVTLRPAGRRPPLGLRWFAIRDELEDRLGRPVDLVTDGALNRHVRPFVIRDLVVLHEE